MAEYDVWAPDYDVWAEAMTEDVPFYVDLGPAASRSRSPARRAGG